MKTPKAKRDRQILVKLSEGELKIAVELSGGTTVASYLRILLHQAWEEKRRKERKAG